MNVKLHSLVPTLKNPPLHPGRVVAHIIDDRGTDASAVSETAGWQSSELQSIIDGQRNITLGDAARLSEALDLPVRVFENLQANYDAKLAKFEERKRAADESHLLENFPVPAATRLGWLTKAADARDQVLELRNFLALERLADFRPQLTAQFRSTGRRQHSDEALEMWLRMGEKAALARALPEFDEAGFRRAIVDIRALTRREPEEFLPTIGDLCAEVGVGVVMVDNLPNVGASGATWWHNGGTPWIQINPKGNYLDHLWFTFFHEAGHVLSGPREALIHLGPLPRASTGSEEEAVANRFAEEQLIPSNYWEEIARETRFSAEKVKLWANDLTVHPGVIVGKLHHEKLIPRTHLNRLRSKLTASQRRALSYRGIDDS